MPEFQLCATWRWLNRARWMGKNHISVTFLHQRCKKILLFRRTSILFKSCPQIWVKCVSIKIELVFWIVIQFSDYLFPVGFDDGSLLLCNLLCDFYEHHFMYFAYKLFERRLVKERQMNFYKNGQLIYGIASKPLHAVTTQTEGQVFFGDVY